MPIFSFEGFGSKPVERRRIENVIRNLKQTEVGRLFLANLPPYITVRYIEGDSESRASANPWLPIITIPQNTFDSGLGTYRTIIHELAHKLRNGVNLDPNIKGLLEGAHRVLVKHQKDRRFAWVSAPLKRLVTEETLAEDVTRLIFKIGYGRSFSDHYYIPGDETVPPKGTLQRTLSANDRLLFTRVMRKLQANKLSGEDLRSNLQAYEEFYQRALNANRVGVSAEYKARLDRERRRRSVQEIGS